MTVPTRKEAVARPGRRGPADPVQQARDLIVGLHVRDHLLHELVLPDFHAERVALLRVFHACVPAGANVSPPSLLTWTRP